MKKSQANTLRVTSFDTTVCDYICEDKGVQRADVEIFSSGITNISRCLFLSVENREETGGKVNSSWTMELFMEVKPYGET